MQIDWWVRPFRSSSGRLLKTRHTSILQSEKIRVVSHHLTHLKLVESDKHAIKEFDRRLPFELEDYAMAAAVESIIPSR